MRRKKNDKIMLFVLLIVGISVGYAAIYSNLKINGSTAISKNTWNVYWDTPVVSAGSVSMTAPGRGNDENEPANTKLTWNVTLDIPGDYYEFTVDAVNEGSIDAMVTDIITTTTPTTLPSYITYSVTYDNDGTVLRNHILPKATVENNVSTPSRQKYKVRVEYSRENATAATVNGMQQSESYSFTFEVQYGQATDAAAVPTFLEAGDYFTLAPDASSATTSYEGFSGATPTADQTLWRVINVNKDGTVEAVSEYVSTNSISISGTDGYKNYIAGLNDIASCYSKTNYTVATRMFGYDGQTAVIQDTSAFDGTTSEAPSTTSTSSPTTGTGEEYSGGVLGDTLYLRDYKLVGDLYKIDTSTYSSSGLKAYKKSGDAASYWIASRYFEKDSNSFSFRARYISDGAFGADWFRIYDGNWSGGSTGYYVRPIITVKSGLTKTGGTGTKNSPYTLG